MSAGVRWSLVQRIFGEDLPDALVAIGGAPVEGDGEGVVVGGDAGVGGGEDAVGGSKAGGAGRRGCSRPTACVGSSASVGTGLMGLGTVTLPRMGILPTAW